MYRLYSIVDKINPLYKQYYNEIYAACASECTDDPACISSCAREYAENLEKCPCSSGCPSGCPCPDYDCQADTDDQDSEDSSVELVTLSIALLALTQV